LEQLETVPRGPTLQQLCGYFGAPVDYFFPHVRKELAPAREWLRDLRQRSFDVTPTIATYSISKVTDAEKEQLDRVIGEKKVAKP
jgi:hypothetical protein